MTRTLRPFFVNLPLNFIARDPSSLDLFQAFALHPELGMDETVLDERSIGWHRDVATRFRSQGVSCAVHLPFFDLQPGSRDRLVREATRSRLLSAFDAAAVHEPVHLIGHLGFDPVLYRNDPLGWQERSLDLWQSVLAVWPEHPPLFLENVREADPQWIPGYLSRLSEERVGFCLDVGHWHSFAGGSAKGNLALWLDTLKGVIGHLHLHDNAGGYDDHLGLGQGTIPLEELFARLADLGVKPGITLEPHSREDLDHSLKFLRAKGAWFETLGVSSAGTLPPQD